MVVKKRDILIAWVFLFCSTTYGGEDDTNTALPLLTGYVSPSVNYMLRSNHFNSPDSHRLYNFSPDGLNLNQVGLTLSKIQQIGFGGVVNIILGREANDIAPYGWNPYFGSLTLAMSPLQFLGQYSTGKLAVVAGELISLAGYENVDPNKNNNFTTSFLGEFGQPNTHTGIRGAFIVNDHFTLMAGLNDGWDTIRDWTREKTLELGGVYVMKNVFSLEVETYGGGQRAQDGTSVGPQSMRNLFDVILIVNQGSPLNFAMNYDYGIQTKSLLPNGEIKQAIWQGVAFYVTYLVNDKWMVAGRAEIFNDKQGYRTTVRQTLKEGTLTLNYLPLKHIILRFEARFDFSNANAYVLANGNGNRPNQQLFGIQGIYNFSS